ncbi:unnamed protein product [Microthlaspi erraticum]|uniref:Ubiquitin-like protease family profile domain-containing protein n=1 Tax=Microthlaspi erraticum TaxID=1685480 RepID=A0A6D2I1E8_9BRAS|nr:unnamed protein product [Microthlaspi erraticum]
MKRQKVIELDSVEKTKSFNIDWDAVLGEEEEVPDLEIIGSDFKNPPPDHNSGDDLADCVRSLTDSQLDEHLERQRSLLSAFSNRLPDKGAKIGTRIGNIEYEKQLRMLRRTKTDTGECKIVVHPKSSDVFRQANTSSKDVSRSTSAAHFPKVDSLSQSVKLFNEELQVLGRESLKRESLKSKAGSGRETITKQNNGWRSVPTLRKSFISENNFYSGVKDPKGNRKSNEASVKSRAKESSPYLLVDDDDDDEEDVIGYETPREWSLKASSCRKKSDAKIINLDEEEPHSPMEVEESFELPQGLPEDICYPSRDDPDHVQLSLKDLKCLSPGECLTSAVINFYIRFLQHHVFSANQTAANSHFFNTFFYKKLIEAVSYKGNNKDAFFVKFRRWWKGFDLFRKSYIFIPIHEDLHWSLVIICIPDKEDESGLTILHLDSLGLHPRDLIFNNIKRFLREEWNYLNQDGPLLDLPISEKNWNDLPNSINEAEVQVPQQKNDFDCGLFVLFFITRFIEEAPQRLTLKDLGMIHKKWFKPNEASALRHKLWNKLVDLFRNSNQSD